MKDSATEKQYKFTLHRSLEKAQEGCLLQGYKIHVTKSVKPEPSQMKGKHIKYHEQIEIEENCAQNCIDQISILQSNLLMRST